MRKRVPYRITVRVEPAVKRYLLNRFPVRNGAIDMTGSRYYWLVSQMLSKNNVSHPSKVPKRYERCVPVSFVITQDDFYTYGWIVPELQQWSFSRAIMGELVDKACHQIALLTVTTGCSRSRAISTVLNNELYEDNELSYAHIRKHYYRKYMGEEKQIRQMVEEIEADE